MLVLTGMFRLLLIFLALAASVHAATDPAAVPPIPQDIFDYPMGPVAVLFLVAALMTLVMVPVCLIGWALFIFILVMILKMCGVPPAALLMKLVQRQMMGKGKNLVWQLGILICIPAGIFGLRLAIWMFSVNAQSTTVLVIGSVCGVLASVAFIYLAKALAARAKQKMMGGMGLQPDMMAQFMKMRQAGGMGMGMGGNDDDDNEPPRRRPRSLK